MIGLRTHNVIRRHPFAGVIAAIMVLFVPLFFLLFMQMKSVLHEEDYLKK
jgi:TM2 domain-containing membrane protein YozV